LKANSDDLIPLTKGLGMGVHIDDESYYEQTLLKLLAAVPLMNH
jgi:hypothetical protein